MCITALDATLIDTHCKNPTKRGEQAKDPEIEWGKAKCKWGWCFGYKAQMMVDAEDYLPLYSFATPANVSD
ncbi:MAG: transposase [Promethearchaeota archaeon]